MLLHFNSNNIIHNRQFGFTKGRSTMDAEIALTRQVLEAWEQTCDAIGVFCDLSKAFDCVRHDILLNKLKFYGITDEALQLISSYLSNRVQKVTINGVISNGSKVIMGMPQGSILGPFLFLIYINDLPYFTNNECNIVLFADDTSLLFKIPRGLKDFEYVNRTLLRILEWFTANNLKLNAKKNKMLKVFSL